MIHTRSLLFACILGAESGEILQPVRWGGGQWYRGYHQGGQVQPHRQSDPAFQAYQRGNTIFFLTKTTFIDFFF